jgi:hypothetical protein
MATGGSGSRKRSAHVLPAPDDARPRTHDRLPASRTRYCMYWNNVRPSLLTNAFCAACRVTCSCARSLAALA